MKLRDVMISQVQTLTPNCTIKTAAQKMRDYDVGSLPVMKDGKVLGMVTDRDLVIRGVADGLNINNTTALEVAQTNVICGTEDQDIVDALKLMQNRQIRRLPVVDRENSLVGLVSLGDIASYVNDEITKSGNQFAA